MLIGAAVLACLLAVAAVSIRLSRSAALERIRREWGAPVRRNRKLDAIAASHRSRVAITGASSLDDRTWDDLNLDAVFTEIDRTGSTLGQHALYHRLRSTPDPEELEAFETLVSTLEADTALRERAQLALGRLQDPHGYDVWWLARGDAIESRRLDALFPLLTVATLALVSTVWVWPALVPALIGLLVLNVLVRYATDRRIGALATAFRQLPPLVATAESLRRLMQGRANPLIAALERDTPGLRRVKTIGRWVTGDPFMLSVSPNPLAIVASDVVSAIYEYLNLALLLDATGVYFAAADIRARGPAFTRVVAALGDVDAALGVGSYRAGRNDWTRPRFVSPGSAALLADLVHPLVPDAVPNTITLHPGRGVLVTGSNMSGKSTCLRTVGVGAVMAQTINTCLASRYEAPRLAVQSSIGRADDLLSGRSYYIVEVERLLSLVAVSASRTPHLFLLDELFRGTNAIERIAAGQAILMALVGDGAHKTLHTALAATHDGELVDLLPDAYDAHHFGDAIGPDGLTFDHRLRSGPATSRNAIALLRLHGATASIVESATECAAALDRERGNSLISR
jgi:hypothetical protein